MTLLITLSGLLGQAKLDHAVDSIATEMSHVKESFETWSTVYGHEIDRSSLSLDDMSDDLLRIYDDDKRTTSVMKKMMVNLTKTTTLLYRQSLKMEERFETELPKQMLDDKSKNWQSTYSNVKRMTDVSIVGIVFAIMLAIITIAWTWSGSIQWSLLLLLWMLPMAYTMVGIYLSASIGGADFCFSTNNSTMQVFQPYLNHSKPQMEVMKYYLYCKNPQIDDGTVGVVYHPSKTPMSKKNQIKPSVSPFHSTFDQIDETSNKVLKLVLKLNQFADKLALPKMKDEYLLPMQVQLQNIKTQLVYLRNEQGCETIHNSIVTSFDAFCNEGIVGTFALFVHQMSLCVLLLLNVACLTIVWDQAKAQERRMSLQYQLLGTYEEDNVEHVYLTPE